jgi:hypothetical protein
MPNVESGELLEVVDTALEVVVERFEQCSGDHCLDLFDHQGEHGVPHATRMCSSTA